MAVPFGRYTPVADAPSVPLVRSADPKSGEPGRALSGRSVAVSGVSPQALAMAREEARLSERRRLRTILTSPAAAERPASARHIAFETDLSAEAACNLLGALPGHVAQPSARAIGGGPSREALVPGFGSHPAARPENHGWQAVFAKVDGLW